MSRRSRHPVYVAVLAFSWAVLQQDLSLSNLILGAAVGVGVLYLSRHFRTERVDVRHPMIALRLVLVFAKEILVANFQVAWTVVQPRLRIRPAFILVPLELRDDLTITMLANMITLTPGTLTIDLAPDRSALYVHCLSADDADSVRAQIKRDFEKPLLESLQCSPQ